MLNWRSIFFCKEKTKKNILKKRVRLDLLHPDVLTGLKHFHATLRNPVLGINIMKKGKNEITKNIYE